MEVKDWITILSVLAVIAGWFISGELNRRNEIAKKRFDFRMNSLQSFLEIWFFIQKNSSPFLDHQFLPLIEETRKKFLLYGKADEINLFEKFVKSIENKDLKEANIALSELVKLVRNRIREELKLEKIK